MVFGEAVELCKKYPGSWIKAGRTSNWNNGFQYCMNGKTLCWTMSQSIGGKVTKATSPKPSNNYYVFQTWNNNDSIILS